MDPKMKSGNIDKTLATAQSIVTKGRTDLSLAVLKAFLAFVTLWYLSERKIYYVMTLRLGLINFNNKSAMKILVKVLECL